MELDIHKILSLLLVRAKYIILVGLIFAFAFFGFTKVCITEKYNSNAKFLVVMDAGNSKTQEASFVKEAIHSHLEIFNTTKFFKEVAAVYNETYEGEFYTADEIKSVTQIKASSSADAPSFTVNVTTTDPDLSYNIAKTLSELMISKAHEYEALNEISLIDDPIKPLVPSTPSITKNTIIGLVLGALISGAVIVTREMLNKKIKNLEDLTNICSFPILGVVPDTATDKKSRAAKKGLFGDFGKENQ